MRSQCSDTEWERSGVFFNRLEGEEEGTTVRDAAVNVGGVRKVKDRK